MQYLYQLGLLHLLNDLFGRVAIPRAVVDELAAGRRIGVAVPDPAQYLWLEVQEVAAAAVLPLAWDLGNGEREVLALALEQPGALVILDDRLARQAAHTLGIPRIGTLGVLLRAKQARRIQTVKLHLDQLDALGVLC
ncbi:MAG TPA: hypothetical protein VNK95_03120 [Caldilineaceae bacterium]|nr:hypothetical protein [Caldilineaceae bacterium]